MTEQTVDRDVLLRTLARAFGWTVSVTDNTLYHFTHETQGAFTIASESSAEAWETLLRITSAPDWLHSVDKALNELPWPEHCTLSIEWAFASAEVLLGWWVVDHTEEILVNALRSPSLFARFTISISRRRRARRMHQYTQITECRHISVDYPHAEIQLLGTEQVTTPEALHDLFFCIYDALDAWYGKRLAQLKRKDKRHADHDE